jgi:two-component system, OmpR family, alkaline phosphatase synthesis response regulator PhoP
MHIQEGKDIFVENVSDKKNILIVDDEPHIVNLVKLSLDKRKYDVSGAYSAREALRLIDSHIPDVIIVDLMMPGVNGYELCQSLRENLKTKQIPIIILSAKGQMNDKLHAIDVGADDYITKPFDPMELERRIKLNLGTAS